MKSIVVLFLSVLCLAAGAQTMNYSRVKIYTDGKGLQQLASAGVCVDHGNYEKGISFTSDFSQTEIDKIAALGFRYEILIEDVKKFYRERNEPGPANKAGDGPSRSGCSGPQDYPVPTEFALGSMGGFFTYQQMLDILDTMAARYPNLFKARAPIDNSLTTSEGRPLYWVRISNNPNVDQNKPQILYTALHHAREPESLSQLIFYMYYLLENYGTDPEVTYLVDHTEMYFIPCLNPDGYVYNETTDPQGGGMWRKNMRDNGDGTFGVDLNRNYGYQWGYDDNGSSPNTGDETYRGPSAFSEPETQMIRDFCNSHQFRIALNYHTYGNLFIFPYGYAPLAYTPDTTYFDEIGHFATEDNSFLYGLDLQTVGYSTNGSSDDWMYGEQNSKPKIYSITPEVEDYMQGFWPAQNDIIPLCIVNVKQNLRSAHLILNYAEVFDEQSRFISDTTGFLHYRIKRMGLDSTAGFTVQIIPLSSNIVSVGAAKNYSALALRQEIPDSISFHLSGNVQKGDNLSYILQVSNGAYSWNDTVNKMYGGAVVVMSNDGSNKNGFNNSSPWGVNTNVFFSPGGSLTESPVGDYDPSVTSSIKTTTSLDLTDATHAHVMFREKYATEVAYDYVTLLASTDGGSTWQSLCGKYTRQSQDFDFSGLYVYDGREFTWLLEDIDLDDYVGQNVQLRFQFQSDGGNEWDGFYFDDFTVEKLVSDSVPVTSAPELNEKAIKVYPNPANDYVTIKLSNYGSNTNIRLVDALGKETGEWNTANGLINIPVQNLPGGFYFLEVESPTAEKQMFKLVVSH